jgi:acetoin utilization protein AcuB
MICTSQREARERTWIMTDQNILTLDWGVEHPATPVPPSQEFLVGAWMTTPARVIQKTTPVLDAYELMISEGIRRLPVVEDGRVVGIVTLGDLREARPSRAPSLSIYELNFLLARLTVEEVMTHNPFTVTPETPLREVAEIMLHQKVGGLPVVDAAGCPVGVITESDLFRLMIERWAYFSSAASL